MPQLGRSKNIAMFEEEILEGKDPEPSQEQKPVQRSTANQKSLIEQSRSRSQVKNTAEDDFEQELSRIQPSNRAQTRLEIPQSQSKRLNLNHGIAGAAKKQKLTGLNSKQAESSKDNTDTKLLGWDFD